jgi:hypothetical protein
MSVSTPLAIAEPTPIVHAAPQIRAKIVMRRAVRDVMCLSMTFSFPH